MKSPKDLFIVCGGAGFFPAIGFLGGGCDFLTGAGFFVGGTGEGRNCMRISYGNVTPEKIEIGIRHLGDLIRSKL